MFLSMYRFVRPKQNAFQWPMSRVFVVHDVLQHLGTTTLKCSHFDDLNAFLSFSSKRTCARFRDVIMPLYEPLNRMQLISQNPTCTIYIPQCTFADRGYATLAMRKVCMIQDWVRKGPQLDPNVTKTERQRLSEKFEY